MTCPARPLSRIVRFDPPDTEPVIDHPRPDRLVQGNPQRRTWTLHESAQGDLASGIWQCEPGAWRIVFPPGKDEYFFVLEGRLRLHDARGGVTEVTAGQGAVIPGGFEGVFEVIEPVRKHFVVVERG
ncbi:cupin domain-containing protein [Caldimonas tepidiphila]|uniref:cupin domain-containing protein n=1 Tax=Caldimonas tepidiphila TaxID=2315841 RepID=UPI000E5B752D|nr:cupin domain-containing protein [Caldimonas tepidiphila]